MLAVPLLPRARKLSKVGSAQAGSIHRATAAPADPAENVLPLRRAVADPARAPAPLRTRTRSTRLFEPFALRAASIDRIDAASSCSSAKTCPHLPHTIVAVGGNGADAAKINALRQELLIWNRKRAPATEKRKPARALAPGLQACR